MAAKRFSVDTSAVGQAAGALAEAQRASDSAIAAQNDVLSLAPVAFTGNYADMVGTPPAASAAWGDITGTLTDQTDLVDAMKIIENRTSDPGSPAVGRIWLRTDL
jgi:hypothetical protein